MERRPIRRGVGGSLRAVEQLRLDSQTPPQMQRGWKLGAEDFADWLAEKLARRGSSNECARERRETDEALGERPVRQALAESGCAEKDLASRAKSDPLKVQIARSLRSNTPMTRRWIAERLRMGSASYLSALVVN